MHTEHLTDELLQRHFDGDLDRTEAVTAQAHLDACGACTKKRVELARLSELVVAASEEIANQANFTGLFERIERGIANERASDAHGARVVSLAGRRRPAYATVSAVVAGFAAAAAVLLMVYRPSTKMLPDAAAPQTAPSATPQTAPPLAITPSHSEVVQVDFGSNAGTVFDIALADGSSTPVVWINDDE